ncbi:MAG: hypothetical protein JXA41_09210 [Deltaproteobacteria bacterium]|nr:hypothetical protein [Deltaproteobacteria bacterium]
MTQWILKLFRIVLLFVVVVCLLNGCDSADQAIDEATGHRAVKQYEKSKEMLNAIDKKHQDKLKSVMGDEDP